MSIPSINKFVACISEEDGLPLDEWEENVEIAQELEFGVDESDMVVALSDRAIFLSPSATVENLLVQNV